MRAQHHSHTLLFFVISFVLLLPVCAFAQQAFHGDGATNNGSGGWAYDTAAPNQCLSCHRPGGNATDMSSYLTSGHKNVLRKVTPGKPWAGADGTVYQTTDDFYGSGSTYDWSAGTVSVGGPGGLDPQGTYPYYNTTRPLYYLFGGWADRGQLDTIFQNGFTGEQYPNGNYDCARCHTSGYSFDASGPEPTYNASKIPDALFSRVPTDYDPASGQTSSWHLDGVQCERCHVAANGTFDHTLSGAIANGIPSKPKNQSATALCLECHRQENADTTANTITLTAPLPGNNGSSYLIVSDGGSCSDSSSPDYATCVSNSATWNYAPFFDHESGSTFLNSSHARFNGTLALNNQNSPDLSVNVNGTYNSFFKDPSTGNNGGCLQCHDAHQTPTGGSAPFRKNCNDCHQLAQTILATTNHPAGSGTPFPTGTSDDIPGACVTCHMSQNYHLMRISTDAKYSTFPSPAQMYDANNPQTTPNMAADGVLGSAVWSDLDLACGQCHVGNDGKTPSYGMTLPPGMPGAHAYTKAQLASLAANIHAPDAPVPTPTFAPKPTTYNSPQTVTISESLAGATIYYTTDGSLPTTQSAVFSAPITISATTTFRAIAVSPGIPNSNLALATYSINLPTAPPPQFSPTPSTFSSARSVTLSNTAHLAMYYTTDGSGPNTGSNLYAGPIAVATNTTIRAIAADPAYLTSPIASGAFFIQAPAPTFSLASGTYSTPQSVKVSDAAGSATIYYSSDGTIPTTSSKSCSNPCTLTFSAATTIKAIASGGGYAPSSVSVATYTIAAAMPAFSPASGTYYTPQTVTITDASSGVTIYYTTNNTFPTTSSASCTSPCTVAVPATQTLRAMATGGGLAQSSTAVGAYTIAANAPTFSPAGGTYLTAQTVTISDTTSGVTIYYTTNNTFPTTSSPSCTSPCTLSVATTETVRAIAAGGGFSQSSTAVVVYTIKTN